MISTVINNSFFFRKSDIRNASVLSRPFQYLLLRIYFIFLPFNLLIVKLLDFQLVTYWKDSAMIICLCFGLKKIIKNKTIAFYLFITASIIIWQLLAGFIYFEYITWFIMGL